jgi:hypothetical protein
MFVIMNLFCVCNLWFWVLSSYVPSPRTALEDKSSPSGSVSKVCQLSVIIGLYTI